MNGTIKYFNRDRGFGFIATPGAADHFFHMSQVQFAELPTVGDAVNFEPGEGRHGKPVANSVTLMRRRAAKVAKPYYGKAKFRTEVVEPEKSESSRVATSIGLGGLGLIAGGPLGGVVGVVLGALFGETSEAKPAVTRQVEITSPCIRCGGQGQVTASVDGWTGFQCKKCRNFWRRRDEDLE